MAEDGHLKDMDYMDMKLSVVTVSDFNGEMQKEKKKDMYPGTILKNILGHLSETMII